MGLTPPATPKKSCEEKEYELCLIDGVEGSCISLNNYHIAGPTPWGGGRVLKTWKVTLDDILRAVPEIVTYKKGKEDAKNNC